MQALPIPIPTEPLREFCQRNHIRCLAVFGSALRNDFRPDSDIDLLVEFEPEHTPSLLQMARLERELSALFGGRKIDLRTKEVDVRWIGLRNSEKKLCRCSNLM